MLLKLILGDMFSNILCSLFFKRGITFAVFGASGNILNGNVLFMMFVEAPPSLGLPT